MDITRDDRRDLDLEENADDIVAHTVEELRSRLCAKDHPDDSDATTMIPEAVPGSPEVRAKRLGGVAHNNQQPLVSEDGLILPRKPANPCLESSDRLNLHRELMFNQKIGKNVLNQKSELQRALEKHKDAQARKECEKQIIEAAPELEKVIAVRAKRMQDPPPQQEEDDRGLSKEFLEARAKLRARNNSK